MPARTLYPRFAARGHAGVEVKAAGARFAGGVVLYDGDMSVGFGDSLYAVPVRALWEAL